MKYLRAIVLFFCMLALVWGQTVESTLGEEFQNPEFLKAVNNYFGCKTWDNGVCV